MKLFYEIEIGEKRVGNDIVIETDTIEYDVDDFDIVCAYMKGFFPELRMAIIRMWSASDEEGKKRFVRAIMKVHREEIEDFFRQRALNKAFI